MPTYDFVNDLADTHTGTGGTFTSTTTSNESVLTGVDVGAIVDGYGLGLGDSMETQTHTFSQEVAGAQFSFFAINTTETIELFIDGVAINLNDAIASGVVTLDTSLSLDLVTADGKLIGGVSGSGLTHLTINVSFTSVTLVNEVVSGTGGNGVVYSLAVDTDFIPPVCFCRGTLISTENGHTLVEDLSVGDLVKTTDHGLQAIRWIGEKKYSAASLAANPRLHPVRIVAGALGGDLPKCDLLVSYQHRILISSNIAERMFGQKEVLISAIKLAELPGIDVDEDVKETTYFHILFNQHEIIYAQGIPSESLFTGPEAMKSVSPEAREEIRTLFPELSDKDYKAVPARFIPKGKLQRELVAQLIKKRP